MFLWLILFLILIFIVAFIVAYQLYIQLEEQVLFVPVKKHTWAPNRPYQQVWIACGFRNGQSSSRNWLHGWYFDNIFDYGEGIEPSILKDPSDHQSQRPVVLFCHGNTGNISHRDYVIELCHHMHLSLLIFDYQGYGYSSGQPTLDSVCQDGEDAYKYLTTELGVSSDRIIIWGESLGGAVATNIASKYPCSRLLLMATFADLSSLAWDKGGIAGKLSYPFLFLRNYSNCDKIHRVKAPIFIAHSSEDEIIPYSHAEKLYSSIPHQWKMLVKTKGGHGTPVMTKEFLENILRFSWVRPKVSDECLPVLDYIADQRVKHGM